MADWRYEGGSLLVGTYVSQKSPARPSAPGPVKLAMFDLDGTLIETKSGAIHALDEEDWRWWDPSVPEMLREAYAAGYDILIISNQGRLTDAKGNEAPEALKFKAKVDAILRAIDVPVTVYAACANDNWRKPRVGTWNLVLKQYRGSNQAHRNPDQSVDLKKSYFVGDAAGREDDHSDIDYHFALNLGVQFITPELFFLGISCSEPGHKFEPEVHSNGGSAWTNVVQSLDPKLDRMILLVGLPGAGKTTFYQKILYPKGYGIINGLNSDTLENCLSKASDLLKHGNPVVIDHTNSTITERKPWIDLASEHGIKPTVIHLVTPPQLCLHNDAFRALAEISANPDGRQISPYLPSLKLAKAFQDPKEAEGYRAVYCINFQWLGTDDEHAVWRCFWY